MNGRHCWFPLLAILAVMATPTSAADKRAIRLEDWSALREVSQPEVSRDGRWVAYTVNVADNAADGWQTDLWLASWDGRDNRPLTHSPDSESTPRFSRDGRYLAFLSSRGTEDETSQLWLLDLRGGEARRLTELPGGVEDYAWSPDGSRLVLVASDPDPRALGEETAAPPPIVVDRYYFKEDESGYLDGRRRHLYLVGVDGGEPVPLTSGDFEETHPSWSPDGREIAFLSRRDADWDRSTWYGLYVMRAERDAPARLLHRFYSDSVGAAWLARPAWHPDGRDLAVVVGSDAKLLWYGTHRLAVVPLAGGAPRIVTAALDRNIEQPHWSADGRWLYFLVEDDGYQYVARVRREGGAVERRSFGGNEVLELSVGGRDRIAVSMSTPLQPLEAHALDGTRLRPLSRQNDALLAQLDLIAPEVMQARSPDGTTVSAFLTQPRAWAQGAAVRTLMELHGGPAWQFAHRFEFDWQLYAAQGYAVLAPNPRGSTGRGEPFAVAALADWGNLDVRDVLAAMDEAVARGVADPDRLGVFGWSYGGILTNYVIASDTRFKAAVSGSGASNFLAGYGTDMYIHGYEQELGTPWANTATWLKLSYPFLKADRIRTPTLFMCGSADFNVPLLNSEQMYQALRSLGVPTQLVIYPDEYHGLSKLSYIQDRSRRHLEWFDRHLPRTP
ncbi:MAG: S9 family peptidase [Gammaproteobacteria bacterium]|nr:S9 family peptidase [Gammaproteobacteria bacterium]